MPASSLSARGNSIYLPFPFLIVLLATIYFGYQSAPTYKRDLDLTLSSFRRGMASQFRMIKKSLVKLNKEMRGYVHISDDYKYLDNSESGNESDESEDSEDNPNNDEESDVSTEYSYNSNDESDTDSGASEDDVNDNIMSTTDSEYNENEPPEPPTKTLSEIMKESAPDSVVSMMQTPTTP